MIIMRPLQMITNGSSTATINPQGAVMQRWHNGKRDLLFLNTTIPGKSSFPCIPAFGFNALEGQSADGSYRIGTKTYKMPRHGFGRDRLWGDMPTTANTSLLQFEYVRNNPDLPNFDDMIAKAYPFPGHFRQAVRLPQPDKLTWQLAFTYLSEIISGDEKAPVDLACHLFLPWEEGFSVEGLVGREYLDVTDPAQPGHGKISDRQILAAVDHKDWQVDLESGDSNRVTQLLLNYPKSKYSLVMDFRAGEGCLGPFQEASKVVIWQDPKVVAQMGPYICLNPVLKGRDSFRLGTSAQLGHEETASMGFSLSYQELP